MSLAKKLLTLAAPAALLALGGCATGLPTKVSRYQAMPVPAGQSFVIQPADPQDRGGLEFARYADLVRRHMIEQGYSEAPSPEAASLVVSLAYGVDDGRQQVVTRPAMGWGYGGFGYRPYWSRYGGYGRFRSPFYYGWDDPFWWGGYGDEIDVYTVYHLLSRHGHQARRQRRGGVRRHRPGALAHRRSRRSGAQPRRGDVHRLPGQ